MATTAQPLPAAPPLEGGPLAIRDFRLLCITQLATGLRMPMTFMTQSWYVASVAPESQRVLLLGVLATLNGLAFLGYVLFGGAFADRYPRRLTLYVSHGVAFAAAAGTAALLFIPGADEGGPWLPLFLVLFAAFGVINAQDLPARTAMIRDVVPASMLTRAVTIFQFSFAVTMVAAGPIAGFLIESIGSGGTSLIASLWHVAILVVLWRMRVRESVADPEASTQSVLANVREGIAQLRQDAAVRWTVLVSWIGMSAGITVMGILVAAWAGDVLDLDASGWGLMMLFWGLGGMLASGALSLRGEYGHKGLLFLAMLFVFGLSVLAFGLSRAVVLAFLFNGIAGATFQLVRIVGIAIVQTYVENRVLGRVMGLLLLAQGIAQSMGVVFGVIGQSIGLELLFPAAGIGVMLLAAAVFVLQPPLRRLA